VTKNRWWILEIENLCSSLKLPNLLIVPKEKGQNLLMASKGFLDKKQETA
jgi:hypothetical protein